jgi:hypothetical protein
MALKIQTFSNVTGGSSLFKAVGHPLAAPKGRELVHRMADRGPVAVYDPVGMLETWAELFDLSAVELDGVFVQDVEKIGTTLLGQPARPISALAGRQPGVLFIAAFDVGRLIAQIRHLIPEGTEVLSLDEMRLPDDLLTDTRTYLSPLNFATNFVLFRDGDGHHTRLVTANYWGAYGGGRQRLYHCLFDGDGNRLAEWTDDMPGANATVTIDSSAVRERFGLGPFCGSLFVHVVGAAGHDVVKYALDTDGDDPSVLSCTHDANSFPADFYGGLPAPRADERVLLWVQNSHPCEIPAGAIGLNPMGRPDDRVMLDHAIPPFATVALDTRELFPDARWPTQFEVVAGRYFVRPRYEVVSKSGRQRIAHCNVERTDLKPDPRLAELGEFMGKGHILTAPVLPVAHYRSTALPTPMSTAQTELPIQVILYDAGGTEVLRRRLGNLQRHDSVALSIDALLAEQGAELPSGYGHLAVIYDFAAGRTADGWLHGLFRYEHRDSGHIAESSFGAHIYNTVLTYRNEPQSYAGRPPGLSTRLFLRLGPDPLDSFCHLIYPASTPWHPFSHTELILTRQDGAEVARRTIRIACSGSHLFRYHVIFRPEERRAAGPDAYILIRDTTCRLFGYHGLLKGDTAFSLDHMFGF